DSGMSMPLDYISKRREEAGGSLNAQQSAEVLANIALTLGWVTFEPFLFALVSQDPDPPSRMALRECSARILDERMAWSGPVPASLNVTGVERLAEDDQ